MLKNNKNDDNDDNCDYPDCHKTLSDRSCDKRQHNLSVRMRQSHAPKYLQVVTNGQMKRFPLLL